jgi:hypothetical protein
MLEPGNIWYIPSLYIWIGYASYLTLASAQHLFPTQPEQYHGPSDVDTMARMPRYRRGRTQVLRQ